MPDTKLYASVGADLIHFDVDVPTATLTRRGTVSVPLQTTREGAGKPPNAPTLSKLSVGSTRTRCGGKPFGSSSR